MVSIIICHHCGKEVPRNPRIKKQKYCSSRVCQNARRLTTNKVRTKESSESRKLRGARNKRWRVARPAYAYQKTYRENHPEYIKRNRELQRKRNKKRQKVAAKMIVKTYALSPEPLRDGAYVGFEVKNGKIVKTYAFLAGMGAQSGLGGIFPPSPG